MIVHDSRVANLQRPILVRQSAGLNLPEMDERYFEKLAAFGFACLAAAIVGKLVMTALAPKQTSGRDS